MIVRHYTAKPNVEKLNKMGILKALYVFILIVWNIL